MDERLLQLFQAEIANQCRYLLDNAKDLMQSGDGADAWRAIQGVLAAAAMLSKLLRDHKAAKYSRAALRERLGVDDSFPFMEVQHVRNYFEHLDERLEDWFDAGHSNYIGRHIGPPGMIQIAGEAANSRFHQFNPETYTVTILDKEMELHRLILAAREILPRAERAYAS